MISHPETLEELAGRLADLETRVARLERAPEVAAAPAPAPAPPHSGWTAPHEEALNPAALLGSVGIAGLGIAGAYLMRAISGPGLLPRPAAAFIALVYSIAWIFAAGRVSRRNRSAGALYSGTAMLILAPMLWEMCLSFHAIPASVAAGVLVLCGATAGLLLRGPERRTAFSIVFAGLALTAFALCIATREMLPFAAILLAMGAWGEVARLRRTPFPVSRIALLAGDAAVWAMLVIYRAPAESRPEYPSLSPLTVLAAPILLLFMQIASISAATILRREKIAVIDALQACVGLALTACGMFWLVPALGPIAFAILALVISVACYVAALGPFRGEESLRNRLVFASWGAVLGILGIGMLLPIAWAAVVVGIGATAAVYMGIRSLSTMLLVHGISFLTLAGIGSGLALYIGVALVGQGRPQINLAILTVAVSAVAVYAICGKTGYDAAGHTALRFVAAMWAAAATCALLTHGLLSAAAVLLSPQLQHIALLRTIALCAAAFAFAAIGNQRGRRELAHVAYTLLAFGIAKLFFEDLRHGHLAFTAGSICMVAVTLIAIPRMAARQQRA